MFIDYAKIKVTSGAGGNGSVSFRREACVPRGGPDGGDGGDGGSVYFQVDTNLSTLMDFRYQRKYKAQNGEQGMGQKCFGKKGDDITIRVPPGTIIRNTATGDILRDCGEETEPFLLLKGGHGGRGNVHFVSSVNQAPRQYGKGGEEQILELTLELKLISDVGLVGHPNAGKSTLLSVISAARPKIADYPFTTLAPMLGVVRYNDELSFTVADIPGLIEGAHENKGLGHKFLRHIQRTRFLVFLLDMAMPVNGTPAEDYKVLLDELKAYDKDLLKKPRVIAANKMDLPEAAANLKALKRKLRGQKIIAMSSGTNKGVKELLDIIAENLFKPKEEEF